ncbi:MAG: hypothetical protein KJ600_02295 [Nanoarchaeota archaeon]|nr:hypothetical protein [Nanoarchaeota archaeon]MBU1103365.1 hypothetical protein [Nanoarchaeota archaeon]
MMKGFIAVNRKKRAALMPVEDVFSFDARAGIMVVADGVTRDCKNGTAARRDLNTVLHYPRLSLARRAANLFCSGFREGLRDVLDADERIVRGAFKVGNERIEEEWRQRGVECDYLKNDFPGCVAAGAVLREDVVHWGYICDAGVAVLKPNGDLAFRTPDESPHRLDRFIWGDERLRGKTWADSETRRIIRRDYRNKPLEEYSFGVLTGEAEAAYYVRTGTRAIKPDDYVLVYTDGVSEIMFGEDKDLRGKFVDKFRERDWSGLRKLSERKVHSEGTLVYASRGQKSPMFEHARDRVIGQGRFPISKAQFPFGCLTPEEYDSSYSPPFL